MMFTTFFIITLLITSLNINVIASQPPIAPDVELTNTAEDQHLFATEDMHYVKSIAAEEKKYNLSALYDLDALREFYEQSPGDNVVSRIARRLVGSNCIRMERGTVTPYYECIGC
jgi:DNA-binding transcriptional ArsR family regulator